MFANVKQVIADNFQMFQRKADILSFGKTCLPEKKAAEFNFIDIIKKLTTLACLSF